MTYQKASDFIPQSSKQAELIREVAAAGNKLAEYPPVEPIQPSFPQQTQTTIEPADASQLSEPSSDEGTPLKSEVTATASAEPSVNSSLIDQLFSAAQNKDLIKLETLIGGTD